MRLVEYGISRVVGQLLDNGWTAGQLIEKMDSGHPIGEAADCGNPIVQCVNSGHAIVKAVRQLLVEVCRIANWPSARYLKAG